MRRKLRIHPGEEGQVLLLALVFITAITVLLTALLNNVFTSYATTGAFLTATQPIPVDGAMEQAIADLRTPANDNAFQPTATPSWYNPAAGGCPGMVPGIGGNNPNPVTVPEPGLDRSVTDGVLNSTTNVTSATAHFTGGDVRAIIGGTGIPTGTYVVSVTNSTTVVIFQAATTVASGETLTIDKGTFRLDVSHCHPVGWVKSKCSSSLARRRPQWAVQAPPPSRPPCGSLSRAIRSAVHRHDRQLVGPTRERHLTMQRFSRLRSAEPPDEGGFTLRALGLLGHCVDPSSPVSAGPSSKPS